MRFSDNSPPEWRCTEYLYHHFFYWFWEDQIAQLLRIRKTSALVRHTDSLLLDRSFHLPKLRIHFCAKNRKKSVNEERIRVRLQEYVASNEDRKSWGNWIVGWLLDSLNYQFTDVRRIHQVHTIACCANSNQSSNQFQLGSSLMPCPINYQKHLIVTNTWQPSVSIY